MFSRLQMNKSISIFMKNHLNVHKAKKQNKEVHGGTTLTLMPLSHVEQIRSCDGTISSSLNVWYKQNIYINSYFLILPKPPPHPPPKKKNKKKNNNEKTSEKNKQQQQRKNVCIGTLKSNSKRLQVEGVRV